MNSSPSIIRSFIICVLSLVLFLICLMQSAVAQNVGINGDGSNPESNTMLDIKSTGNTSVTFGLKVKDSGANDQFVVRSDGNVGINESLPDYKLDIIGFKAIRMSDSDADATTKNLAIHGRHYSNSEKSILYFWGISTATSNILRIGSSHSSYNAPTSIRFLTAATNTTLGGTTKMFLNSSGNLGIGTTTPKNKLDVEGGMVVGSSYSGTNVAPTDGLLVEGKVGIGTNSPGYRLATNRSTAVTNNQSDVSLFKLTSTGNMVDGFGPAIKFGIEDDANVEKPHCLDKCLSRWG